MYNESPSFAVKMKCFSALAFLPLEDVVEGFETLTEDVDVLDEFLVYFEHTYMIHRCVSWKRQQSTPSRCHFPTQALECA